MPIHARHQHLYHSTYQLCSVFHSSDLVYLSVMIHTDLPSVLPGQRNFALQRFRYYRGGITSGVDVEIVVYMYSGVHASLLRDYSPRLLTLCAVVMHGIRYARIQPTLDARDRYNQPCYAQWCKKIYCLFPNERVVVTVR